MADIIIIGIIALGLFGVLYNSLKRKKTGQTGCSSCSGCTISDCNSRE